MGLESLLRRKQSAQEVKPVQVVTDVIVVNPNSPALKRTRTATEILHGGGGIRDPHKLTPQRALPGEEDEPESLWVGGRTGEFLTEAERRAEKSVSQAVK